MTATGRVNTAAIPAQLTERDQWVVWKTIERDGRPTKAPYNAQAGTFASSTDPRTWAPFDVALAAYETDRQWDGIGYVFSADDPFAGVDLDDCIDENDVIDEGAWDILDQLRSYSEVSPSGRGIKIIIKGKLPPGKRRRGKVEMYDQGRFFTITGDRFDEYPWSIFERSEQLAALHEEHIGSAPSFSETTTTASPNRSTLDDDELIKRIRHSEQKAKFDSLWSGNFDDYDSQSEADMALCNILAFWTDRSYEAIDRLFRRSGLYREKWERQDYRDTTINEAIGFVQETYQPGDGASVRFSVNGGGPVSLNDFQAYLPEHKFIFIPTRELWPAKSVDERIGTLGKVKASNWLDRNQAVEQMTWAPGHEMLIYDRLIDQGGWIHRPGVATFNLYRAPEIRPGDSDKARPWIEHVHRIYPSEAEHLIAWLAHRVQFPGQKVNHAIVLGGQQGIGKDTLLEPVKHAVGPWNVREVSPTHLLESFNEFIKSVILRVSEARDLGDVNRYALYDHLKIYTASPPDVLRCNEKYVRQYSVLNVCGVVVTTNHKTDGIYLPADDRRHFVAWSNMTLEDFEDGYWQQMYGWYEAGGIRHVGAYLQELDLSDFDPKAPPPKTAAFWDIVDANRAPEDAELADVLDRLSWPDALTLRDIIDAADETFGDWLQDRRNRRQIPHRMEAVNYIPVRNEYAQDGLWKVKGKRQVIYVKSDLSVRDRIAAADDLIQSGR